VTVYSRIRRQQLIQEAEGYLDLILAVSDPLPLDMSHRVCLAKRAIAALDQLDHTEFCHGRAHYLRGQAFRLMEKHHQAIDALLKAAEIDPLNVHIHLALAWCYKRVRRIDLAIQSLEDALEIDPDRGILHYNLACYWSLANNVGLTLAHLAKAIESSSIYRQLVADEPDFDPVRNHPEFMALANVIV
jgi:tetratricopeptide (TPR) repeat protein